MRKKRITPIEEQAYLDQYNPSHYERPSITADILVFTMIQNQLRVLLMKRKGHPFQGCWAIPGGFVDIDESIEAAAYRELKEETGVENVYLEQLYTFSDPQRDPRMRVISTAYMALVSPNKVIAKANDDAVEVQWFVVNDLLKKLKKEDLLAFDHEQILMTAMERLRGKLFYTNVAFQLVEEEFTIRELRTVFEEILGKALHGPNFRRVMLPKLIATGNQTKTLTRPAALYCENKTYQKDAFISKEKTHEDK